MIFVIISYNIEFFIFYFLFYISYLPGFCFTCHS